MTGLPAFTQEIILPNTEISRTIALRDTLELQYTWSPSPGDIWWMESASDSTIVTIALKSDTLMPGQKPIGGKHISILGFCGVKRGKTVLVYAYGQRWQKQTASHCTIEIMVK